MTSLALSFSSSLAQVRPLPRALSARLFTTRNAQLCWAFLGMLALFVLAFDVGAAANTGLSLKPAFDTLDGIVNGYGKQVIFLVLFALAAIGILVGQAAPVIGKFIGGSIFLGVALAAGTTLIGAVV